MRCANCGETSPDILEPLGNGGIFCPGCDHFTPADAAREPRLPVDPPVERTRRDLD